MDGEVTGMFENIWVRRDMVIMFSLGSGWLFMTEFGSGT